MTREEARQRYGFDPEGMGLRHRGWWIVDEKDGMATKGDLCVCARDGGGNDPDCSVDKHPNYKGSEEDCGDCTYLYYYFAPLESEVADCLWRHGDDPFQELEQEKMELLDALKNAIDAYPHLHLDTAICSCNACKIICSLLDSAEKHDPEWVRKWREKR